MWFILKWDCVVFDLQLIGIMNLEIEYSFLSFYLEKVINNGKWTIKDHVYLFIPLKWEKYMNVF